MEKINWKSVPSKLSLKENEVHIYRIDIDSIKKNIPALEKMLTAEEKLKISNFVFEKDRITGIISKSVLKDIISRYLSTTPENIVFLADEYGKPYLDEKINSKKINFNLSHSGSIILFAVTSGKKIGIDVQETGKTNSIDGIIKRFSCRENALFNSLPPALKTRAFYACWTRKEAYIKAHGTGLSYGLKNFSVSIDPDNEAELLHDENNDIMHWSLKDIFISHDYASAVTVEGKNIDYKYFSITPGFC